jgi:diguanylate cyclase (GGDEF)-like protein/PAS domain S-box-containing protein
MEGKRKILSMPEHIKEEEFRDFLETLPDAIIIVDESGIMTMINRQAEKLFGFSHGDLTGEKVELLIPDRFTSHPAHRDNFVKAPSTREMCERDQLYARKKNGEEFPVEIALSPLRSGGGTVTVVCSIRDVTRYKESEEQLRLAADVFEGSSDGILILDAEGRVIRINKASTLITGFIIDELIGKIPEFMQFGSPDDPSGKGVRQQVEQTGRLIGEAWHQRKNGEIYSVWQTVTALKNDVGEIRNFVVIFSDISESQKAEEQINHLLQYDPLTNLPNRHLFNELGIHALQRAHLSPNGQVAVLYLDLDGSQQVNDSLGYSAGDRLLQLVSQRFKGRIAEGGIVARIASDEFAILLEDIEDPGEVASTADAILASFRAPFELEGNNLLTSTSIGISVYPNDGDSIDALLKHAATATKKAKKQGKNAYHFYSKEMTSNAVKRLCIESDLRLALEREELVVYYQPQFSLETGQVTGAEALVRWFHPEKGLVSPVQFISVAEESGLIVPLGEWVLNRACKDLSGWHQQNLPIKYVSVNVAGLQVQQGNLVRLTETVMAQNELEASNLELEITENFIMDQARESLLQLDALKEVGIGLAIDDFGTGYSSLSYLKRLPIDTLKIDQSFVRHVMENTSDRAIIRAIIALGKSLEFSLIAEGVETAEQHSFLKKEGCDIGQGFLFSRPIPANEFEQLLRKQKLQD